MTLLRWPPALGAEEREGGVRGPHFPVGIRKDQRDKNGAGVPANKGTLALSWKK